MKYYIVAGEASGDLHGANLIRELHLQDAQAEFRVVGGDRMAAVAEQTPFLHSSEMGFMGFVEVVANAGAILRNLKAVKADILQYRPDALILIDFPGFNMKLAAFAKKNGIKNFYYISPKVWAWNQKRVEKIKKQVDHLFCILPFEVDFYKHWGMKVDYVGNPLLDAIDAYSFDEQFREKHELVDKPIIALLPGSRKMEISRLMPEMMKLVGLFPGHQFVVAGAPNFDLSFYQRFMGSWTVPVVFNQTYDLLRNCEAAVVTSGTATLETALLNIPQVVVYKANPVTILIAKNLIQVDYISLVNLIMNEEVVKELIQKQATSDDISEELDLLLNDKAYRSNMLEQYAKLSVIMGEPGASHRVAGLIFSALRTS